jgi:hypothetical protein
MAGSWGVAILLSLLTINMSGGTVCHLSFYTCLGNPFPCHSWGFIPLNQSGCVELMWNNTSSHWDPLLPLLHTFVLLVIVSPLQTFVLLRVGTASLCALALASLHTFVLLGATSRDMVTMAIRVSRSLAMVSLATWC